jgi:hypothetical protein
MRWRWVFFKAKQIAFSRGEANKKRKIKKNSRFVFAETGVGRRGKQALRLAPA